ncbi:MAG: hypothetical protein COA78_17490 [Blastopirellula sp.]|nr:MAG: hypothetical protein COA78_17490 [Blastopirellula sp.]
MLYKYNSEIRLVYTEDDSYLLMPNNYGYNLVGYWEPRASVTKVTDEECLDYFVKNTVLKQFKGMSANKLTPRILENSFLSALDKLVFNIYRGHRTTYYFLVLSLMAPSMSSKFTGKVSVYQSKAARDKGQRVALRMGKFLGMLLPDVPEGDRDSIADELQTELNPRKFTLHVSQEADAFEQAYVGNRVSMRNPRTTSSRKSLADSCLRYSFDHLPEHPARVYDTGDFSIIYLTDDDGDIAARCVVRVDTDPWVSAPIYGVCDNSIDMIEEYLSEHNAVGSYDGGWYGARLRVEEYEGSYIGPYLDGYEELKEIDGYLVVDSNGSIDCSCYEGVLLDEDAEKCIHCDNTDYDMLSVHGNHVCNYCYDEDYIEETLSGDMYYNIDMGIAWYTGDDGCEQEGNFRYDKIVTLKNGKIWYVEQCSLVCGEYYTDIYLKKYQNNCEKDK